MSNNKILNSPRLAIVGLGAAARNIHLPAYKKISNLTVVGGYDPVVNKGDEQFGFPLFDSVEELISETQPDILSIVTPTSFHHELTKKGLLNNCHVFCEKPFTDTLDEARELIELSKRHDRWVIVNNQFRFMECYQAAKKKIGAPDFGELLFLSASQTFYVDDKTEAGWRGSDPQRTCKEFGIHVLDLCRFFFDEEPESISAVMPKPGNPDGPDYLNLIRLDFSGGRSAQINLDRLTRGRHRYLDLRLDGAASTIETEFGGNVEFKAGIRGGDRRPYIDLDVTMGGRALQFHREKYKKIASDPIDIFANATSALLKAFIDANNQGNRPPCCAQDNIKTLALVHAAYESNDTGAPVAFAERWQ